jgi:hypothetical protein
MLTGDSDNVVGEAVTISMGGFDNVDALVLVSPPPPRVELKQLPILLLSLQPSPGRRGGLSTQGDPK